MHDIARRAALLLSYLLPACPLLATAPSSGQQSPVPATACHPVRAASFDRLRIFSGTAPVPLAIHCGEADKTACHIIQLDPGRPEFYQGDLIAPSDSTGPWTCATVGGWDGWVPADRLIAVPAAPAVTTRQWLGEWVPLTGPAADNRLILTRSAQGGGQVHVEGKAVYTNAAHNTASGEVSGDAVAQGPFLRVLDSGSQPDCVLDLKYEQATRTFRAVDNQRCGGHNVTFNGVWKHR